ncbi:MAG TPA: hypothetical protein PLI95_03315 [Polyangiaceae bacterium]|nr:hypothetical protein [Polyangiaceae bacterium]
MADKDIDKEGTEAEKDLETSPGGGKSRKPAKIENPSLPKDRNARVREQAARKMAEAKAGGAKKAAPAPGGLSTEELVDDALARGVSSVTRWAKKNVRLIEGGVVALIAIGIGLAVWDWQTTRKLETASDKLMRGVENAEGRIIKADEQPDPEDTDPRPKFASLDARKEATVGAYRLAAAEYSSTGAGILARLGEGGALLDRNDFDGALKAFRDVLATPLSQADVDVRLNATEGVGMALEGKGDVDGALKEFRTLENSDVRGYAELGLYHQARLLMTKKNDRETAKAFLVKARDRLATSAGGDAAGPKQEFLKSQVHALLRDIDPSLAPASQSNPLDMMSIEQMMEQRRIIEQLRRQQQNQQNQPKPQPTPSSAPAASK